AGKYRGWAVATAPLDDRIRFRVDSWVRLLVRIADDAAVRRLPPAGVAALFQRRCGTWAGIGTFALDSRASIAVSVRRCRADRCDHPLGPGGPYGLALDARTRRQVTAVPYPVARVQRCRGRYGPVVVGVDPGCCGPGLAGGRIHTSAVP